MTCRTARFVVGFCATCCHDVIGPACPKCGAATSYVQQYAPPVQLAQRAAIKAYEEVAALGAEAHAASLDDFA